MMVSNGGRGKVFPQIIDYTRESVHHLITIDASVENVITTYEP
jgi:hypothetical protein